jgi:hypothetical protein
LGHRDGAEKTVLFKQLSCCGNLKAESGAQMKGGVADLRPPAAAEPAAATTDETELWPAKDICRKQVCEGKTAA